MQQRCHLQVKHLPAIFPKRTPANPAARPSLSRKSLCRSRRAVQRDVRMGQLFHHSRFALRQSSRARRGDGRKLSLRNSALWRSAQRQPHLLPWPFAAAFSQLHDSAVYDADRAAGHADPQWLARAYQFAAKDYDQWTKPPHLAGTPACLVILTTAMDRCPKSWAIPPITIAALRNFSSPIRAKKARIWLWSEPSSPKLRPYRRSSMSSFALQAQQNDKIPLAIRSRSS